MKYIKTFGFITTLAIIASVQAARVSAQQIVSFSDPSDSIVTFTNSNGQLTGTDLAIALTLEGGLTPYNATGYMDITGQADGTASSFKGTDFQDLENLDIAFYSTSADATNSTDALFTIQASEPSVVTDDADGDLEITATGASGGVSGDLPAEFILGGSALGSSTITAPSFDFTLGGLNPDPVGIGGNDTLNNFTATVTGSATGTVATPQNSPPTTPEPNSALGILIAGMVLFGMLMFRRKPSITLAAYEGRSIQ